MPSPRPGFSTLTTSAPRSPSSDVHHGPAAWCERSMTRMPASAARRSVMPRLLPASASPRPRALTLRAGSCLGGRMAARLELPADHPHVAVVTIDRPAQANALDPPTLRDLAAAWRAVAADPEIRCAVLTGAGEHSFCAGMDMKTTIPAAQRFARGERIEPEVFEGLRSVATALLAGFDLATPLVCAVNGHARAGGFDLMLAAEIRYAVPEATFALEEVALGLYPTGNATVLLPRQIAWVHAHELLLTARPIDARRALEIGLVNRIVPRDRLMATALETADAIAANAPLAVRETRRGVREILHLPLADAYRRQEEIGAPLRRTEDAREAQRAFLEKRRPVWRGRGSDLVDTARAAGHGEGPMGLPLWYFGYGSNMHRSIFHERRRMQPLATRWGWLEGYRLRFNIPVGPGERACANLELQPEARTCGVLYLLT